MSVIIAGAGLSGLSAAFHLGGRGVRAEVLEREREPGGACRTLLREGFCFDLTGHLLHLSRPESTALLRRLGILGALRRHRRRAAIALAGVVTPYPIQIHTQRLPAPVRRDCLLGFVEAHARGPEGEPASFAAWVLQRFGEGFARHFFFPYNRKLYCTAPEELTTEWVGRYVPRPRLADVIDGALGLYQGEVGYNASFLYPRAGGIRMLPDTLAAHTPGLSCGEAVRAVSLAERVVETSTGRRLPFTTLIWTGALPALLAATVDPPPRARAAAAALRAVAVVNLNLGVRGRAPRREHWLYVPEERFPFYRVGIPSNHGALAPPGCHTLSVEVSIPAGAPVPADLTERCLVGLEELGLLGARSQIVVQDLARIEPAYVVYDRPRPEAVATLRDVYRAAGVLLCGRWAEWKYSTMEDALWDGASAARRVAP